MKIKKIYRRSKVGLFVGLLSFHTLSSCANTGRQLGTNNQGGCEKQVPFISLAEKIKIADEQSKKCDEILKFYGLSKPVPWYKSKKTALYGVVIGTFVVGGSVIGWYFWPSSSGLIPVNTTMSGNRAGIPGGLPGYRSGHDTFKLHQLDKIEQLFNASMKKGEKEWGNNSTTETPSTTAVPKTKAPKKEKLGKNSTTTTPPTPNDLDTKLSACLQFDKHDLNILTQNQIDYLMMHRFSPESIECVFGVNRLHPDAKDTNDNTACIGAAKFQQLKSIQDLESKGADCYSFNKHGNSAMDFVNLQNSEGIKIANHLGASDKAKLCKKNKRGRSFKDKPGTEGLSEIVQNKLKNCS
ncbi:hypothetical protein [Cardinium endosymbiont of Nabis limbatus]|uniref:hypothetical protein n=1 Tax=Cardinium endosymbiont of Nabis limbatus TaxID=3066217 RepID=UPI003AF377BE